MSLEGSDVQPPVTRPGQDKRLFTWITVASVVVVVGLVSWVVWAGAIGQRGSGAGGANIPVIGTMPPDVTMPPVSETPAAPPSSPSTPPASVVTSGFNTTQYSTSDPASIWAVVNKRRPMQPRDFVPPDLVSVSVPHTNAPQLRQAASDALVAMFNAGLSESGIHFMSLSAYRSYTTQQQVYNGDDAYSARPGYSEHQTGLADDIGVVGGRCALDPCFGDMAEAKWLAANAYRFGFILRYPSDKQDVTGYNYEPWHFRYVGTPLATEMRNRQVQTLEEFFALGAAPTY